MDCASISCCCQIWRIEPERKLPVNLPPPMPPSSRKDDIFDLEEFVDEDHSISQTPWKFLYGSYEDLAKRLTNRRHSDVECARALFHWMTSLDCSSVDSIPEQFPDSNTPMEGLMGIVLGQNCHAHFFARLARAAGLACVVISGVTKNGSYVVGERRLRRKRERRAQWNAVLVDGEWRLLDVLWASCALVRRRVAGWALIDVDGERLAGEQEDDSPGESRYHNNEFFFLTDPDQFVCTHLPDDPDWQLLPQSLVAQQFETFFYIRERFFDLGLTMVNGSQRRCVLKTTDAEVTIKFGIPAPLGARAQFRYMLFRQKTADEESSGKAVTQTKGCVIGQLTASMVSYTCHMAEVGRYRFDVFGRDLDRHHELDLVCSYVIECDTTDGRYLPDDPEIGWGPGTELDEAGLVPNSHFEAIVYTDEPELTIRFHKTTHKRLVFWQCLKHLFLDEATLMSRAVLRMCGDYVTIVVRLPEPGEYAYKLFCDRHNSTGLIPNVCNYLIRFYRPVPMPAPFPPLLWGVLGRGIHAPTLGVKAIGPGSEGYVKTSKPEVKLRLNMSQSKCEVFYEIECLHIASDEPAATVKLDVLQSHVVIHVTLTATGEYGLNVYVRPRSGASLLHHVHSLLIDYQEGHIKNGGSGHRGSEPFSGNGNSQLPGETHPDISGLPGFTSAVDEVWKKLGTECSFGSTDIPDVSKDDATSNATEMSALAPSPQLNTDMTITLSEEPAPPVVRPLRQRCPTETCVTTDDVYRVMLPHSEHSLMLAAERLAAQHPVTFVRLQRTRGEAVVSLPLLGVYVVDVFEVDDTRRLKNVQRLNITRHEKKTIRKSKSDARFEAMYLSLIAATEGTDIPTLQQIIEDCTNTTVPKHKEPLVKVACTRLTFLEVSQALRDGIARRHRRTLQAAVKRAEVEKLTSELGQLFEEARDTLIKLTCIDKMRHEVGKMNSMSIAEIKSYTKPQLPIQEVMKATLLILGEQEECLQEWKQIGAGIGQSRRGSLQKRIKNFDIEDLDITTVLKANDLIEKHKAEDVQTFSSVTGIFYKWCTGIIDEAKTRFVQDGGDLAEARREMIRRKSSFHGVTSKLMRGTRTNRLFSQNDNGTQQGNVVSRKGSILSRRSSNDSNQSNIDSRQINILTRRISNDSLPGSILSEKPPVPRLQSHEEEEDLEETAEKAAKTTETRNSRTEHLT